MEEQVSNQKNAAQCQHYHRHQLAALIATLRALSAAVNEKNTCCIMPK